MGHGRLEKVVEAIEHDIVAAVRQVAREAVSIVHYGAFDIHPRYLVYWICVKSDDEKRRLEADDALSEKLRHILVRHNYPSEGRDAVHIGVESQETIDRESGGNWWAHWK